MIELQSLHRVRGQALMTSVLLIGAVVGALLPGFFRSRFEAWSSLGYESETGQVVGLVEKWSKRTAEVPWTEQELKWLFEGWLREDDARLEALFLSANPSTQQSLVALAERGCVCGGSEQKMRSLDLLGLLESPESQAALERLAAWAKRRKLFEVFSRIEQELTRHSSG